MTKNIQEESQKRAEALGLERSTRESVVNSLQTQLDKFGADGLHLETAGLVWLILGIVLATAPTEVAMVLQWYK